MKYKQNRIQEYRKQNYGINTNHTKYDDNGNILYYQTVDYNGNTIEHYYDYDNMNNKTRYHNSNGYVETYKYQNRVLLESTFYDNKENTSTTTIYNNNEPVEKIITTSDTVTVIDIDIKRRLNNTTRPNKVYYKVFHID